MNNLPVGIVYYKKKRENTTQSDEELFVTGNFKSWVTPVVRGKLGRENQKINLADFEIKKNCIETFCWNNSKLVCGVDEAGRGCLAGPVVAGAAVLTTGENPDFLKDSKILSKKDREFAFEWIKKNCVYGFAVSDIFSIEKNNILQATRIAMNGACFKVFFQLRQNLKKLGAIVVDSVKLDLIDQWPGLSEDIQLFSFNKGESLSSSVAAASIVAKVVRDSIVDELATAFPGYGLDKHKGYATKQHLESLQKLGPSIIHRKKFVETALKNLEPKVVRQTSII